jgi:hypothetical protein
MISFDSVKEIFELSAGMQTVFSMNYSKLLFASIFLTEVIRRPRALLIPA